MLLVERLYARTTLPCTQHSVRDEEPAIAATVAQWRPTTAFGKWQLSRTFITYSIVCGRVSPATYEVGDGGSVLHEHQLVTLTFSFGCLNFDMWVLGIKNRFEFSLVF